MTRLAAHDVKRLLRFVGDAEELTGDEPFSPELLEELGNLVPADGVYYCELDRVRRRELAGAARHGDSLEMPDVPYWEIAGEHPVCREHNRGTFNALKLSDFVSLSRLRRSRVYALWFRPVDVE